VRDLFVLGVVFGLLPLVLTRPYIGILLFSWLAYMRPQDLCWGYSRGLPFSQWVAITMLTGWLIFEKRPFLRYAPPVKWVFFLFAWVSLSMFLNPMLNPPRQMSRWMDFLKVLVIALFTIGMIDSKNRLHLFLWVVALSLGFFGIKGGAWGLLTGGRINQGPGGMLKDNNDLCLALNMNIPILFYLGMANKKAMVRRLCWIAMLLCGVAVLITGSRGGFLTLAAVTGILVLKSRYRVVGAAMGMTLVFLFIIFLPKDIRERLETLKDPTKESSAASRLYAWGVAMNMIAENPVLGIGYSNFLGNFRRYESNRVGRPGGGLEGDQHVAHNSYLQVWAESGTPAFLGFLTMIISTILLMRRLRRRMRARAGPRWFLCYTHMIEVSLCAFLIGGTFLNRAHFDLLYHMVAVGCILYRLAPQVVKDSEEEKQRRAAGKLDGPVRIEVVPNPSFVS